MAEAVAGGAQGAGAGTTSMRTVVAASCSGTAFEWYDFFIFGNLIQIISKTFFAELGVAAGLIAALALFGVGFAFRPLGALIFGGLGDRIGRKAAFLITVTMMGGSTFAIGLLPTFAQVGRLAPLLLILLRIIQGTALGGQYGGAAIYVAEHAPRDRRGYMTAWVQTSAAFGLVGALSVIFLVRKATGEAAFAACVASPSTRARVEADVSDADAAGVAGRLPTYWIGDTMYRGAKDAATLRRCIDDALHALPR